MTPVPHACWSCRGPIAESVTFCPTCRVIQPPDPAQTLFALFDMSPGFDVALDPLEARYQALQQQFHPDRFANSSATERRYSMEQVTRLNEGLRTLRDPLSRAVYLLRLAGRSVGEGAGGGATDLAFLMEVMEQREQLEALDLNRDGASASLEEMRTQVVNLCMKEIEALGRLFKEYDQTQDGGLLDHVVAGVDRLRYHNRFLDTLDQREESLY